MRNMSQEKKTGKEERENQGEERRGEEDEEDEGERGLSTWYTVLWTGLTVALCLLRKKLNRRMTNHK